MAKQSQSRSERESQQAHDEAAQSFPIARPVREWFGKILDAENRQIVSSVSPEYAVQIVHLLNHGAIRSEQPRRWIRVEERLPKPNTDVLVWCGWAKTAIYKPKNRPFIIQKPKFDWHAENGVGPIFNITHWMPLPERPAERLDETKGEKHG